MIEPQIILPAALLLLCGSAVYLRRGKHAALCLYRLAEQEQRSRKAAADGKSWQESGVELDQMKDRWGRAGYVSSRQRKNAQRLAVIFVGAMTVGGAVTGLGSGLAAAAAGGAAGLYLGMMIWLFFMRHRSRDLRREMLFQLPLVLEGLILLVEAGIGVLPAMQKLVSAAEENGRSNPLHRLFRLVYQLSAHGLPFGDALRMVADAVDLRAVQHVLLHLDISNSEGGELVPSLRSLSDHAHTEWRLSVETRVKRLENLVVFPVFCSVIGLLFLTAAVPAVSIVQFMEGMEANRPIVAAAQEQAPNADRQDL